MRRPWPTGGLSRQNKINLLEYSLFTNLILIFRIKTGPVYNLAVPSNIINDKNIPDTIYIIKVK
jgi:hypothetical protein